ncbi:unnamed protein product [Trichogramma brassicae]|uniref:Uncharacterized protein n=1 Tax=Trichogramma brassicae TaxID=86971 RepID=A0A6H5I4K5_9HYME|nr:unnamed protein product [Trichogramma brassicae]
MENRAFDDEQRRLHQAQMQYHQQANLQQQQLQQHVYPNQQQLHMQDNSMDFRLLQQSYNGAYHNQQRAPSESHHLYEDIVHPYATSASFQRNLTLPLRNNKSCESLDKLASSVRVTSRERTLIVDRINRDDTLE